MRVTVEVTAQADAVCAQALRRHPGELVGRLRREQRCVLGRELRAWRAPLLRGRGGATPRPPRPPRLLRLALEEVKHEVRLGLHQLSAWQSTLACTHDSSALSGHGGRKRGGGHSVGPAHVRGGWCAGGDHAWHPRGMVRQWCAVVVTKRRWAQRGELSHALAECLCVSRRRRFVVLEPCLWDAHGAETASVVVREPCVRAWRG